MSNAIVRTRMARMVALMAAMLVLAALVGCQQAPKTVVPRGGANAPVSDPQLVHGQLPGLQIVAVSKLSKSDQQAIAAWQAGDGAADKAPTLTAGGYKPDIDGHVLEAARAVSSDNGIATSVINVTFDATGTKLFADLTAANVGRQLAVVFGGKVVSVPSIAEPIASGNLEITGSRESIDAIAKLIVPAL
jgi:preprotein translocase subunit SecD